jgi:hypothetical protein
MKTENNTSSQDTKIPIFENTSDLRNMFEVETITRLITSVYTILPDLDYNTSHALGHKLKNSHKSTEL